MTTAFKIFIQVVMILSALGLSSPDAVCASSPAPATMSDCCGTGMMCKCQPDQAGNTSCKVSHAPSSDKSIPAREASAPSFRIGALLFTIVPARPRDEILLSAFRCPDLNASPPFGGSSPQAVLHLWRI